MMAAASVQRLCIGCSRPTKYRCTRCEDPVCTCCSEFEKDESTDGWITGKSVAYCKSCVSSGSDENDTPKKYKNKTETGHASSYKRLVKVTLKLSL